MEAVRQEPGAEVEPGAHPGLEERRVLELRTNVSSGQEIGARLSSTRVHEISYAKTVAAKPSLNSDAGGAHIWFAEHRI